MTLINDYLSSWPLEECLFFIKIQTCWKHRAPQQASNCISHLNVYLPKYTGLNTLWHTFWQWTASHQRDREMIWEEFTNLISWVSKDASSSKFHFDVIFLRRIRFRTQLSETNGSPQSQPSTTCSRHWLLTSTKCNGRKSLKITPSIKIEPTYCIISFGAYLEQLNRFFSFHPLLKRAPTSAPAAPLYDAHVQNSGGSIPVTEEVFRSLT